MRVSAILGPVLVLATLLTVTTAAAGPCAGARRGGCTAPPPAAAPGDSLTPGERASLQHMREEEKLARDVYLALGEVWDVAVFANIPRAEQRHMDAVGALLTRHGLPDPVDRDTRGAFRDPELQRLHDRFVAAGRASLTAALQVGAAIEELDLADLGAALDGPVHDPELRAVYARLARGSRNHLRAFAAQLAAVGAGYTPTHLSAAAYAAIVDSDWERGRGGRSGRGGGCGAGGGRGGHGQGRGGGRGDCAGS